MKARAREQRLQSTATLSGLLVGGSHILGGCYGVDTDFICIATVLYVYDREQYESA